MVGPINVRLIDPDGQSLAIKQTSLQLDTNAGVVYPSYEQMAIHFDLTDGERYAYSAAEWIATHWDDFVQCMAYVHRQVDAKNPRTTRDDVIAWSRREQVAMTDVAEVVRNHNLWAGVARYMTMLRPRLARTLHFRHSVMDEVDMVAIWHEVVRSDTTFLARDYEEAKRLVEIGDISAA